MIQEVQTYHDPRGAKVLWLKGCECILTENIQKDCDRNAVNYHKRKGAVLDWKDVKLILAERMRIGSWPWQKGTNGLWPKACKWVMIESVQMGYDRKGANGRVWKIANGCDRKVANGLWPKNCKRVVTKGCKWSWPEDCKWVVTKKCKRVVTKRSKQIVTEWVNGS